MPEQRVERPPLEMDLDSNCAAVVWRAKHALQLERDNAALTAEVGRLRKVVEEIATDDITLSERHGSGTSQMGSLRKHIARAALTPPADQPAPATRSPLDKPFNPGIVIDDTPRPIQPPTIGRGALPKPAPATKVCIELTTSRGPRVRINEPIVSIIDDFKPGSWESGHSAQHCVVVTQSGQRYSIQETANQVQKMVEESTGRVPATEDENAVSGEGGG